MFEEHSNEPAETPTTIEAVDTAKPEVAAQEHVPGERLPANACLQELPPPDQQQAPTREGLELVKIGENIDLTRADGTRIIISYQSTRQTKPASRPTAVVGGGSRRESRLTWELIREWNDAGRSGWFEMSVKERVQWIRATSSFTETDFASILKIAGGTSLPDDEETMSGMLETIKDIAARQLVSRLRQHFSE